MVLERTGLSSTLTFNEASAVAAMGRASRSYSGLAARAAATGQTVIVSSLKLQRMSQTSRLLANNLNSTANAFKRLGSAASKAGSLVSRGGVATSNVGRSLGFAALAAAPLTLALKRGAKEASNFEQAMADVAAVNPRDVLPDGVRSRIRELGRTTKFGGIQIAKSFEEMRRSGLSVSDSLELLGPATNLAAAGDMELADATKMMAKTFIVFKNQGIPASEIVDKLGLSSIQSTANMQEMATALTYVSGTAAQLNIPLDQTLAALGEVSTRTKEGSRSGTNLNSMIGQMIKKTQGGKVHIAGMTVAVRKLNNGQFDLLNTVNDINIALEKKFPNATDRAGIASKFFGDRGARAFMALTQGITNFDRNIVEMGDPKKYKNIASEIAAMRLDTFLGQMTILGKVMSDFSVEFFGGGLAGLTPVLKSVISFMNDVIKVMELMNLALNGNEDQVLSASEKITTFGTAARIVGQGLALAANDIRTSFNETFIAVQAFIKNVLKELGLEGRVTTVMLVSFAAKAIVLVGVLAPVAAFVSVLVIAFGALISSMGSIISAFAALKGVAAFLMGGALIPLLKVLAIIAIVVGVVALMFEAFRQDGESVTDALYRLWTDGILPVVDGFMIGFKPAIDGAMVAFGIMKDFVLDALAALVDMFTPLTDAMGGTKTGVEGLGQVFGTVLGYVVVLLEAVVTGFVAVASSIIKVGAIVGKFLFGNLVKVLKLIVFNISEVIDSFRQIFSGDILNGLIRLGSAMLSNMLTPFSQFIRLLFEAAEAVLGIKIPPGIKRFVEAPEFQVPARGEHALASAVQRGVESAQPPELKADVTVEDKRQLDINTCLNVDGREIGTAVARHDKEIRDRAGFRATPWQRRMIAEQGAVAVASKGT